MPLFHVELTGSPACTIEADDTNQAWDLYRVKMGIVKSKHQPRISEATVHASVVAQPQSGTTVAKVELPAPEPAPVLDAPKPDESPVPDAPSGDADDAPEAPEKDAPKPETKSKSKR